MLGDAEKDYSAACIGKGGICFPYRTRHAVRALFNLDRNALSLMNQVIYVVRCYCHNQIDILGRKQNLSRVEIYLMKLDIGIIGYFEIML